LRTRARRAEQVPASVGCQAEHLGSTAIRGCRKGPLGPLGGRPVAAASRAKPRLRVARAEANGDSAFTRCGRSLHRRHRERQAGAENGRQISGHFLFALSGREIGTNGGGPALHEQLQPRSRSPLKRSPFLPPAMIRPATSPRLDCGCGLAGSSTSHLSGAETRADRFRQARQLRRARWLEVVRARDSRAALSAHGRPTAVSFEPSALRRPTVSTKIVCIVERGEATPTRPAVGRSRCRTARGPRAAARARSFPLPAGACQPGRSRRPDAASSVRDLPHPSVDLALCGPRKRRVRRNRQVRLVANVPSAAGNVVRPELEETPRCAQISFKPVQAEEGSRFASGRRARVRRRPGNRRHLPSVTKQAAAASPAPRRPSCTSYPRQNTGHVERGAAAPPVCASRPHHPSPPAPARSSTSNKAQTCAVDCGPPPRHRKRVGDRVDEERPPLRYRLPTPFVLHRAGPSSGCRLLGRVCRQGLP